MTASRLLYTSKDLKLSIVEKDKILKSTVEIHDLLKKEDRSIFVIVVIK